MELINKKDLELVHKLQNLIYPNKSTKGVISDIDSKEFLKLKKKLKNIAIKYSDEYEEYYGEFNYKISSGNPISRHGKFRNVWSTIFKGAINKQAAAQISFVLNGDLTNLDVGFYFGKLQNKTGGNEEKIIQKDELNNLGKSLAKHINSNELIKYKFEDLFNIGFKAYIDKEEQKQKPIDWLKEISINPINCRIITSIPLNQSDVIDFNDIDFAVSQIMFLMGGIPNIGKIYSYKLPKTLTAAQRAKQAEKRTLTGIKGEKYIYDLELRKFNKKNSKKIIWKSQISDSFGYDIQSLDSSLKSIFIEVKTTAMNKDNPMAKMFYLSQKEYDFYLKNKDKYKLYRVYDIEGEPEFEIVDLEKVTLKPNNHIAYY